MVNLSKDAGSLSTSEGRDILRYIYRKRLKKHPELFTSKVYPNPQSSTEEEILRWLESPEGFEKFQKMITLQRARQKVYFLASVKAIKELKENHRQEYLDSLHRNQDKLRKERGLE